MPEPTLDWSNAEVSKAKLTVPLEGELPSGWKQHFETTIKLLTRPVEIGEVRLRKNHLSVRDVAAGSEDKVRHFLESVVLQVNTATRAPETDEAADKDDADGQMTARFRAFGEE